MATKQQLTGMQGVYLVAAELSKRGFIVSPTSRGAAGADLLVTDQKYKRAFSVQIKTNKKTFGFWLVGKKAKEISSNSHIYVLVYHKVIKNVHHTCICTYQIIYNNKALKLPRYILYKVFSVRVENDEIFVPSSFVPSSLIRELKA